MAEVIKRSLSFTEKVELAAHIDRKIEGCGVRYTLLGDEVCEDIGQQIKREFGIEDVFELPREFIYEAHELIDCYKLPFALQEKIKARKRRALYG